MMSYRNKSKDFIKKHAALFTVRAYAGRSRVADLAHIRDEEWIGWAETDHELKESGISTKNAGLLGVVDTIMRASKGRFVGFPLHLWKRRNIYKRLQWLRGELTRLMTGDTTVPVEERPALIEKRKAQIRKYGDALYELKPLHDEIERQRRVYVRSKRRRKTAKSKRKADIKAARDRSRAALRKKSD